MRICSASFYRRPWLISGANFAVAETGTVCIVESEGNGRMCRLPKNHWFR
ncbi:MAG: LUD domain-containing protein [Caldilineaceae bacterium]